MSFELEWLDEEARRTNNVNVTNWLVDKERDIQFWIQGKGWQIRAEGDYSERIMLRIAGKQFRFELMPNDNFRHYVKDEMHEYIWEKMLSYEPRDLHGSSCGAIISIIKEALVVGGGGWHSNEVHPDYMVKFNF